MFRVVSNADADLICEDGKPKDWREPKKARTEKGGRIGFGARVWRSRR